MSNSRGAMFLKATVMGLSLALGACATTPNIAYDSDPAQNFASYSTFSWAAEDPAMIVGDYAVSGLVKSRIEAAIHDTLTVRGYSFVENVENADFAVSYTVGARDGVEQFRRPDFVFRDMTRWGWGVDYFGRPILPEGTYYAERTEIRDYTEGTLSIDIYDVTRAAPVWHGVGERRLTRDEVIGGNGEGVAEDIELLLAGFPPN